MMAIAERKAVPEGLWIAGLQMVTNMNEYSWPSNGREHLSNDDAKVKNL